MYLFAFIAYKRVQAAVLVSIGNFILGEEWGGSHPLIKVKLLLALPSGTALNITKGSYRRLGIQASHIQGKSLPANNLLMDTSSIQSLP